MLPVPGSGGGGKKLDSNDLNKQFGKSFDRRLVKPSRAENKPQDDFQAAGNADDLIRDIPFAEQAISDYNGVPVDQPPFRDISSLIIGNIGNPQLHLREPDWRMLLQYFHGRTHGIANLQDLYMLLTRVALPNAVIDNRRLLLDFYINNRFASARMRLRYDLINWPAAYISLSQEEATTFPIIYDRSIFRGVPTPNGKNMVQWLRRPINTPPPVFVSVPYQMTHQPSQLDNYLQEKETEVRAVHPQALTNRTVRVFNAWWWLLLRNAALRKYHAKGWTGMAGEFF